MPLKLEVTSLSTLGPILIVSICQINARLVFKSFRAVTTLTNKQVVAELGWTMQALSDLNGGRIPMYWRPPYGDVDNRVRAIAKGVFGLVTVLWDSGEHLVSCCGQIANGL